jgi:eukaryotic-like serine/threonine-protein kinase
MCPSRLFRFGLFEVDLENALLTRKGVRVRLQEQPFRILAMLLERPGQIVTREELRQELWPTGTYVDFDGSLNAALKRLRSALDDQADNPRFIETVPRRGYRFIAPVTATVSTAETVVKKVVAAQSAEEPRSDRPISLSPESVKLAPRGRRRLALLSAVFVLVIAASSFVWRRHAARVAPPPPPPAESSVARRSVAVLGFQNASGKPADAWLSTALMEMLRTELSAGDKLRVVPGEDVEQFRLASPWSETDSLNPETTSRIGKALDSDLLVLGSYATLGDTRTGSIRVDFRLQNAQSGAILYHGAETGNEQQFFGLVAKVGVALRDRLGLPAVTESEQVDALSSLPSNPEAERFYALGLEKMRDYDLVTARDLFQQAAKIAPDFPLVHLKLSRTWGALGYDQNARNEARKAFDLSAVLPRADKLLIEGAYYETQRKPEQAITAYRALFALYPDSVDDAVQLVAVQNAAAHREEALAVVRQLRQLPPPTSDDPRIDFWEAKLLSYSNGRAAGPLIDRAVAKTAARGQKILYARFRLEQCLGLIYSEQPGTAEAPCEESYQILLAAGNRLLAADALRIMGDRRGSEGNLDAAVELYQRALEMLRAMGEHEKTGAVLNNMGVALENRGEFGRAGKLFAEAKRNFDECGDTLNSAVSLGDLADIALARGDLRGAEKIYQQARAILARVTPADGEYELYSLAQIRLLAGDLKEARRYVDEAIEKSQARSAPQDLAQAKATLGDILLAQGELSSARQNYQESLDLRKKLGDKNLIAESQTELAALDLEENKPAEAEAALRKSLSEFQSEKASVDAIRTEVNLSRALLMQSKLDEAAKMITDAASLSRSSQDPSLKLPVAIQQVRLKLAQSSSKRDARPNLAAPRRELQDVIQNARRLGYNLIESDAELALAELELRLTPSAGQSHLSVLSKQFHDRGLELVSRKAAELRKSATPSAKPRLSALGKLG